MTRATQQGTAHRNACRRLRAQGLTHRAIARRLGITHQAVARHLRGALAPTDRITDRRLLVAAHPHVSSRALAVALRVSRWTIERDRRVLAATTEA